MRNVLAVCGEPGTGKTTLFRKFMENYSWEPRQEVKLVNTMYCEELDLHIIGKYEEGEVFAGTDRLSMAVLPEAIKFIQSTTSNIMFEGDRLTSTKFFDFLICLPETEVKIIVTKAKKETLKERYEERGSNQSETFLKGRQTKISNIVGNFDYMDYIETYSNETLQDQSKILDSINEFLL